jgi:hypothetical protein
MTGKDAAANQQPTDTEALGGVARSIREVEVLLVALTTLYFFVAAVGQARAGAWFLCTAAYLLVLGPCVCSRPSAQDHGRDFTLSSP